MRIKPKKVCWLSKKLVFLPTQNTNKCYGKQVEKISSKFFQKDLQGIKKVIHLQP
ncbi:MAG: hypothetical protein ACI8XY_000675, partial [bacterium]